jgi:hypothetical protein
MSGGGCSLDGCDAGRTRRPHRRSHMFHKMVTGSGDSEVAVVPMSECTWSGRRWRSRSAAGGLRLCEATTSRIDLYLVRVRTRSVDQAAEGQGRSRSHDRHGLTDVGGRPSDRRAAGLRNRHTYLVGPAVFGCQDVVERLNAELGETDEEGRMST